LASDWVIVASLQIWAPELVTAERQRMNRTIVNHAWTVAAVAAAVLLRWLLDPLIGDKLPLVTLFGAVAAAVWLSGYRAAIAAALVGYLACSVLFIAPRGHLEIADLGDVVGMVAYLVTCALIIGFGHAMRVAQARATQGREVLRVTLRSIGDAVITTDIEGRIDYMNEVAESLTGWPLTAARARPLDQVFRIINEETRQPVPSPAARALREGVVVGLANHTLLVRRDGSECPIDDSAAPIRDQHGSISGCVLIFRDVTNQRRLEHEKASQLLTARLLAAIVESSDDAIVSKSLQGVIQSWNAGAERIFGYTAAQAIGRHISLLIPPERLAEEEHIIERLKSGERIDHFETERLHADGQRISVSLTVSPIKNEAGQVVGASKVARDVTRQRQAEAEREKFVKLVESSTDFVGMCDLQGVPFFINRAGLEMVGLDSIEQASRHTLADFFFPEDQPRILQEFLPSALRIGHGEIDVRFRHFKTGEARWMAYKVLTLTNKSGQAVGMATVSQDVTERRRLEDNLRQLANDLSEADHRKNEFLATLAHELRNPLAPLSNMLEVMKRAGGDASVVQRARDTMERQLAQMVRLVDDLLDLSRITHNRLELCAGPVELTAVIRQALEASRPLIDEAGHALRVTLPAEPVHLHADAGRLAQVFSNLLNNSSKYTWPGGTIELTAQCDGDAVLVSIKDSGIGIPRDKLDSIFDMFVQVDRSIEQAQTGLGIGLTLVKRLVQMHGGSIEARSEGEGQGSEFVVRLPVAAAPAASLAPEPAAVVPPHGGRRILVVDDNSDSAVSLAILLEMTGNQAHVAHDGVAAIEAAERHRPDVVLLDIGLPKLNGHDVCRRIRSQPWGKDMLIIALTGWGQDHDRRRSQEAGFDGHLVKPVDPAALWHLLDSLTPERAGTD
jgi:PAS domain S-box-containing protein